MALAICFEGLFWEGVVSDQSDLARPARMTKPRMIQILNLLHLAPNIQEELLSLSPAVRGKDRIHEKMLRPIAAEIDWAKQRALTKRVLSI